MAPADISLVVEPDRNYRNQDGYIPATDRGQPVAHRELPWMFLIACECFRFHPVDSPAARSVCDCLYGKVARSPVRYGERQRPGARSCDHMIEPRVADAPRTVPLSIPYTHLQTAMDRLANTRTRLRARVVYTRQFRIELLIGRGHK